MSERDEDTQSGVGRREVAYRLFAAEYDDADLSYSESDEERAPNYVVTPTGARVNRLFLVGVLTEVEPASENILRARVVDPTGAFVVYAGQYQPDEMAFLERADPPAFLAITGKARTFQPEDGDRVYTSVRPESINEVSAETRDRWTVQTAEHTLDRVATMARALRSDARGEDLQAALIDDGVDEGLAEGIALAIDHYGTTGGYLQAVRDLALDAARVVAGEREEVEPLTVSPDVDEPADLDALAGAAAGDLDTATATGGETPADSGSAAGTETTDADTEPTTAETGTVTEAGTAEAETAETGTTEAETAETGTAESTPEPGEPAEPETAEPAETETDTESAETETASLAESEPAGGEAESGPGAESDELGDFEPGEFELDEEEREEIESEYGTEFQSGTEVDQPGEADIEPEAGEVEAEPADAGETEREAGPGEATGTAAESADRDAGEGAATPEAAEESAGTETETAAESAEPEAAEEPAESEDVGESAEPEAGGAVDPQEAVMDAMRDLDEGEGAPREEVIAAASSASGADRETIEDEIQEALMDGLCYEPDDGLLKPI